MDGMKQRILDKTTGGFDVFVKYFGEQCKRSTFLNVYRNDTRRSCTLKKKGDKYYLKDYGDSRWSGDCFHVVALIQEYNPQTQFMDVMRTIDKELVLDLFTEDFAYSSKRKEGVAVDLSKPYSKVKGFRPVFKEFTMNEKKYWSRYGIDTATLSRYGVRSLLTCRFTREDGSTFTVHGTLQSPLYCYTFTDGGGTVTGIKTYQPGSSFRFLRAGSVPEPYIFGASCLPMSGDTLYITGGEKDVMSLPCRLL